MSPAERRELGAQRYAYALAHPLVVAIAAWASATGAVGLAVTLLGEPSESALTILLPGWAEALWAAVYFAGGVMLLCGITRLSLRSELAGCLLICGSQIVAAYAVIVERGAGALIGSVALPVALGLLARVYLMLARRSHWGSLR